MGSFIAHFIPATFLATFGFWLLLAATIQAVRDGGRDDQDFLTQVIYNRPRLITVALVCTLFGAVLELPIGIADLIVPWNHHSSASHGVPHMVLYGGYSCFLLSILLERKGLLPRSSFIWWMAVANWIEYTIWKSHATMQEGAEAVFHNLTADCVFLGCIFSVIAGWLAVINHKKLPIAIIIMFYFVGLHGLMLYSIAFYYYQWYRPHGNHHYDIKEWEPPCVFAFVVFTSLCALGVVWNCLKGPRGQVGSLNIDNSSSDPYLSDDDATEKEPLQTA